MKETDRPHDNHRVPMPTEVRAAAQRRLVLIEGQVRGLGRMLDEDRYYIDVLMQVEAVRAALRQVGMAVLRNYLETCVADAVRRGDTSIYHELMGVLDKGHHLE